MAVQGEVLDLLRISFAAMTINHGLNFKILGIFMVEFDFGKTIIW